MWKRIKGNLPTTYAQNYPTYTHKIVELESPVCNIFDTLIHRMHRA